MLFQIPVGYATTLCVDALAFRHHRYGYWQFIPTYAFAVC